jgi:hypothetical protein
MSEPITSYLVNRVERSLRKRLSGDIRPHLLRCAAHAEDIDSFMAAAARLLADAKEREHWLASWSRQRRCRTPEADAMSPDVTGPGGLDLLLDDLDRQPPGFHVKPHQFERLRAALAAEIGPVAKTLIESESQHSASMAELLSRLQIHLQDDFQRKRFLNSVTSTADL